MWEGAGLRSFELFYFGEGGEVEDERERFDRRRLRDNIHRLSPSIIARVGYCRCRSPNACNALHSCPA